MANSPQAQASDTPQLAQLQATPAPRQRWWLLALVGLGLALGSGYWFFSANAPTQAPWVMEKVQRGDISASISASGTLQPLQSVDVGSEQSGTIIEILVHENDTVRKGQILARLDTAKLQDSVERAKANFVSSQATVLQARSNVQDARQQLDRLQEAHRLSQGKVPAVMELDNAKSALIRMQAALTIAMSNVRQTEAALKSENTNLAKSVIRSPIAGVVLARKVAVGQTVAASFATPSLFTIAADLSQMELVVNIDEADVSQVQPDMPVTFTVPAFGRQTFLAQILRIGLGSTITDNVVTYKAVLNVKNPDYRLRPGMTATARIVTASAHNALIVSNTALRFKLHPDAPMATADNRQDAAKKGSFLGLPSRTLRRKRDRQVRAIQPTSDNRDASPGTLWVLKGSQPVAIKVVVGVSDGKNSAVSSPELKEGMEVMNDMPLAANTP